MHRSVIVIEDFYDNPLEIRNMALSLNYPEPPAAVTYPGRNSDKAYLPEHTLNKISELVGKRVMPSPNTNTGLFRISPEISDHKQDIHIDPVSGWAGVWFGSLPEHCQGGTYFWRHKKYGFEWCPRTPEEGQHYGFSSYEQIREEIIYRDGLNRSLWDLTMAVPMRFNRLVLFRPYMWHSHGKNFGTDMNNSRLVQTFFFDEISDAVPETNLPHVNSVQLSDTERMIIKFDTHRTMMNRPIAPAGTPDDPKSVHDYFFLKDLK